MVALPVGIRCNETRNTASHRLGKVRARDFIAACLNRELFGGVAANALIDVSLGIEKEFVDGELDVCNDDVFRCSANSLFGESHLYLMCAIGWQERDFQSGKVFLVLCERLRLV